MERPLRRDEVRVGVPVAYLGDDEDVLDWGQPPVVGVLHSGHPGRVREPELDQHVLVVWSGLESADVSQVVGFATDESGQVYPGLGVLSEDEYQRRVERLRDGK